MSGPSPYTNDIVALGELLIDFTESGISENGNRLFEQNPGGAPANLLSAAAKFGSRTALIGKVGRDMHGAFLKETLVNAGISVQGLIEDPDVFTTLAFVALSEDGEREFSFARKPGADTCLRPDEVDYDLIKSSRIFHFGSLSLTDEPAREATRQALIFAKDQGVTVTYDPNYRASLWPSEEEAKKWMKEYVGYVDIMKIADNEVELVTGETDYIAGANKLHAMGVRCVAVTLGADGILLSLNSETATIAPHDVPIVDKTGAGDAFFGGFLHVFLESELSLDDLTLEKAVPFAEFGGATAECCIGKRGAIPAMPTRIEVEALLAI